MAMDEWFFKAQMERLAKTYGPGKYPPTRVEMIWKTCSSLDKVAFEAMVDRLIGDHDRAPLLPAFREEIAKERERLVARQKARQAVDSRRFYTEHFDPEMRRDLCKRIREDLERPLAPAAAENKQVWKKVEELADGMVQGLCRWCTDGVVERRGYVYRCICSAGDRHPRGWPSAKQLLIDEGQPGLTPAERPRQTEREPE